MTVSWSFSYNCFVKFHGIKIGSHNRTIPYPNLCYNEVCYKRTARLKHTWAAEEHSVSLNQMVSVRDSPEAVCCVLGQQNTLCSADSNDST